ncbi:Holliday junction branch migration protein RuvA [Blastococcus sp. Marseille-P5729]|uniref:Holliday junction branch migration protein RuvA n=1 Tax=Blastococcus sp. Marseille-P5729 TaxID=2086582 RepID=UPI000D0E58E5|nr:Holliday junction branch migration protein RuvA [Blastococcus sp. Marseille-P5729]
MIASLTGTVRSLGPSAAVIEVSGVGMLVHCAPGTLARLRVGEQANVSTSLVVREDSLTLYGFADDDERELFELLQTANGVGPKVAQAVLSTLPVHEVRAAISLGEIGVLTRVPGIGKKGAERMVLDLRDKVGMLAAPATPGGEPTPIAPVAPWREQLLGALTGLGWSSGEAEGAVDALEPQAAEAIERDGRVEVAVLLRAALRSLSK